MNKNQKLLLGAAAGIAAVVLIYNWNQKRKAKQLATTPAVKPASTATPGIAAGATDPKNLPADRMASSSVDPVIALQNTVMQKM